MAALIIVLIAVFLSIIIIAIAAFVYLYFCMIKMFKRVMDDTLKGMEEDKKMFESIEKRKREFEGLDKWRR